MTIFSCSVAVTSVFIVSPHHHQARGIVDNKIKLMAKAGFGNRAGGGFGSSGKKNKKKTKSSITTTNDKVRSVSGFSGSGTKPLRVAANTFDSIHKKFGSKCISDLYVRAPANDEQLCWFVGKIARKLENTEGENVPTEVEAVLSQKRLILEYAKQLRPQNLGGPYAKGLEIWIGPGDSEMDVVQNKVSLKKVNGSTADISDMFSVKDVGYNPEIYVGEEIKDGGLRVNRDADGHPIKPVFEINQ